MYVETRMLAIGSILGALQEALRVTIPLNDVDEGVFHNPNFDFDLDLDLDLDFRCHNGEF